ncbi:MAG: hypothetical protein ACI9OF_002691, partial [Saprospiraceae bacterium]
MLVAREVTQYLYGQAFIGVTYMVWCCENCVARCAWRDLRNAILIPSLGKSCSINVVWHALWKTPYQC